MAFWTRSRRVTDWRRLAAFVAASAGLLAPPASAEEGSTSERLFQDARALLEAENYDAACPKLARSQELDPAPGTLALLAYCHEKQGRTASAHAEYGEAARLAHERGDLERVRVIEQQQQRLTPHLTMLRVVVERPAEGLELSCGGKPVARSDWGGAVPVDPGKVTVEARAPGRKTWKSDVTVLAGGPRASVVVPELAAAKSDASFLQRFDVPVLVSFGVGVAGLGVGSYFGARALALDADSDAAGCDAASRCTAEGFELRRDARSAATGADIAFAAGGIALTTGVVLLLVDRPRLGWSLGAARAPLAGGVHASF